MVRGHLGTEKFGTRITHGTCRLFNGVFRAAWRDYRLRVPGSDDSEEWYGISFVGTMVFWIYHFIPLQCITSTSDLVVLEASWKS